MYQDLKDKILMGWFQSHESFTKMGFKVVQKVHILTKRILFFVSLMSLVRGFRLISTWRTEYCVIFRVFKQVFLLQVFQWRCSSVSSESLGSLNFSFTAVHKKKLLEKLKRNPETFAIKLHCCRFPEFQSSQLKLLRSRNSKRGPEFHGVPVCPNAQKDLQ